MASLLLASAVLLAALAASLVPAAAQPQTKPEQRCTNALNAGLAKVAKARGAAALRCVEARAGGASAEGCLDQADRKLASARAKNEGAPCDEVEPAFGVAGAGLVNDAATRALPNLLEDAFGGDLDTGLVTEAADPAAAACQQALAEKLHDCLDARLAGFNACKKAGLASGAIDSAEDLTECVGADPKGKIAKACGGFAAELAESCDNVPLADAFPGCDFPLLDDTAECLTEAAECRACGALHSADAIASDCAACAPEAFALVPPSADPGGEVEVTVAEIDASGLPALADRVAPVYEFGPDGHEFDAPVTVGIPIAPSTPGGESVAVFGLNEQSDEWEAVPGSSILGPLAVAPTEHFSAFTAAQVAIPGCSDVWGGGPGPAVPPHVPGGTKVTPGVAQRQDIVYSGSHPVALGSEWVVPGCVASVTGAFAVAGDGAWIDYSNGGVVRVLPASGGNFALNLVDDRPAAPVGPHLGIADPCHAALGVFQYWLSVHFAANCINPCPPGSCSDGNPCTDDICDPGTGACTNPANAGSCGSGGLGMCIEEACIVEVTMASGMTGNSLCTSQGMTCVQPLPVGTPPEEICLAFHPTATVTSSVNGWRQAVWCDTGNTGLACQNKTNVCHHCPACIATGLTCGDGSSTLLSSLFAECAP